MAQPKFVIDECLSVSLPNLAHTRGLEAYHVVHRALSGATDHALAARLAAEDAVMVTNNGDDYLRIFASCEVHAGLIIIVPHAPIAQQQRMFSAALDTIKGRADLINRVIEVHAIDDIREYEWPASSGHR